MPSSPYAITKYAGELLVNFYSESYHLPTLSLCLFTMGAAPCMAVAKLCHASSPQSMLVTHTETVHTLQMLHCCHPP